MNQTNPFALLISVQVITYFAGRIYEPSEGEAGRLTLAGDYLKGDASLMISDLSLTDSGEYSCKVKNGGKYYWNTVNLIVLGESRPTTDSPSTPPLAPVTSILEAWV